MVKFAQLPKYEAYKDSGVEWLGEIPLDWAVIKMKFLFKDTSIKNMPNEALLSVTQDKGVVPRSWVENRMVMPSGNLESFKYIEKGDFAISLRSFEGGLEYCHHAGIISPAYTVLKTTKTNLVDIYYKYLFKSKVFISELQTSVVGIREGKNISYDELRYSLLPIPSKCEQVLIANFLDQKTAQIDAAIAIKEQQIELLKERKQIIIQQAVTQGLDPNVPMKDSGVEWIGQIPEHWEVKKLKFLLTIKNGVDYKHVETDEGYPVYGSGGRFTYAGSYLYDGEAVLLGRKGTINKPLYVNEAFWTVDTMFYAVCNSRVMTKYIYFCATTIPYFYYSTATALPSMTQTDLLNHKIAVPSLKEQSEVIIYIEKESLKLDAAIDIGKQQIQKLKEYKTTLINSAVTGKIKITPELLAK